MESLMQNKALLFSLVGNSAVILLLACGFLPDLATQFEIVDIPNQVSFPRIRMRRAIQLVTLV